MKQGPKSHPPRSARLFSEPSQPTDVHIAYIDGAARGNPGPASYGVIIRRPDGQPLASLGKYLGRATNNVAEYYALIAALDYASAHGIRKLRVRSDSELLVRQMQGVYKVKSADLRPLHERARRLAAGLAYFQIESIPREANHEADALANAALDGTHDESSVSVQPAASASLAPPKTPRPRLETRRIRARYRHGALHPAEPLDLPEDAEVEITVHKAHGE